MSTRWSGPELELARPPARPRAFPRVSWLDIAVWFILAGILWIPIIYVWSVIT